MFLSILLFLVGIALIVLGANYLTEGAATLARRLGLSPLMVGLTIVAFGTSAPELVVSLTSALAGKSDIALGNVVGSNLFNIFAIAGVTALIAPLTITKSTIRKEIPLMVLASFVLCFMVFDQELSGIAGVENIISRGEGLVLLCFFSIFLSYTIAISKPNAPEQVVELDENLKAEETQRINRPIWLLIIYMVGGLVGLVYGGDLFVSSASDIAKAMGVSDAIIGLLATSVVAALKGEQEMAIGNVVGSNIFNIFFILGTTATVKPIGMGGLVSLDFFMMTIAAILLYFFAVFFGKRTINRIEGAILLLLYIAYTVYLVMGVA